MNKQELLDIVKASGKVAAATVQGNAETMTGTELNGSADNLPDFAAAVALKNMLERPAGFVCVAPSGRVVKLLQPYDSTVYPQEPEELPAQWGFVWSQDPAHARPFVALATSPYQTGDCCTYEGKTWRSGQDNNVWAPGSVGVQWEEVEV